tara:strand:+ start:709 stop:951 length:243 start_codon:yes stop_codon:yes gene_type:complete
MPTNEPINTIPVQAFLQAVKNADASKSKEIRVNIEQAKQLAFTLGILLANQNGRLEKLIVDNKPEDDGTVQVNMDGGSGW